MATFALLLLQFVVSAKAGLVNFVDGTANVTHNQQVQAGTSIQTQTQSHVEILLNPGSFLRIGPGSVIVLDSIDLSDIAVRIVSGDAIIESASLNKDFPIRVANGLLRVTLVSPGLYRFSADSAAVLNGKLREEGSRITVKKGQQLTPAGDSQAITKIPPATSDDLDVWSQKRSGDLAKANALAYRDRSSALYGSDNDSSFGIFPATAAWLYSPSLGGFTFLPFQTNNSLSFFPLTGLVFSPFLSTVTPAPRPSRTTTGRDAPDTGSHTGGNGDRHAPIHGGRSTSEGSNSDEVDNPATHHGGSRRP